MHVPSKAKYCVSFTRCNTEGSPSGCLYSFLSQGLCRNRRPGARKPSYLALDMTQTHLGDPCRLKDIKCLLWDAEMWPWHGFLLRCLFWNTIYLYCHCDEERMMWRSWMLQYCACTADMPDGKTTGSTGMDDVASLSSLRIKAKRTKNICKDCTI